MIECLVTEHDPSAAKLHEQKRIAVLARMAVDDEEKREYAKQWVEYVRLYDLPSSKVADQSADPEESLTGVICQGARGPTVRHRYQSWCG